MIKVYIDSIELFEKGKEISAELLLPANKEALAKAFAEAEIRDLNDCEVVDASCEIPQIQSIFDYADPAQFGIHEINLLAQKLAVMDETSLERFRAAAVIYKPDNISDAINMTANLGTVNVLPEIRNSYELGSHLVDVGVYKFDDDILPFIDYGKVGANYLAEHDRAELSEMGFIEDLSKSFLDIKIFDGKNLPDDYRLSMGLNQTEEPAQTNEQSM